MSGQGAFGPAGPTGVTGMTGRRGRQGDGFGYTGPNLFAPGGTIAFTKIWNYSSPYSLTVTTASSGMYYQFNLSTVTGYGLITTDSDSLNITSGGPFLVDDRLEGTGVYPGTYIKTVIDANNYTVYPALSIMTQYSTITASPRITVTLPTTGLQDGIFWVFNSVRGGLPTKMQINLVNGTAAYNGNSAATVVESAIGNSIILAYSATSGSYIVF